NTTDAPYGYTATGRIRKKPTKQFLKEAAEKEAAEGGPVIIATVKPTMENHQKFKKKKMLNCPVCFKNFKHRYDPHRAVWQHRLHKATITKDKKHQEARDAIKTARKPEKLSGLDKKEWERINSANWRAKNRKCKACICKRDSKTQN
ncbi:hypothetical protein P167DRAFT_183573, partial [Morchella conica CCBAS932]